MKLSESETLIDFEVYDIMGQQLKQQSLIQGKEIDISSLATGQYFIQLQTSKGMYYNKFIKE